MAKRKNAPPEQLPAQVVDKRSYLGGCAVRLRNYAIAITLFFIAVFALTRCSPEAAYAPPPGSISTVVVFTAVPAASATNSLSIQPVQLATNTDLPVPTATITETPLPEVPAPAGGQNVNAISPVTYYAGANGANLRSCPARTCDTVASLPAGAAVTVNGTVQGESVSGSPLWYRLLYGTQEMYVHSSVVSTAAAPAQAAQPGNTDSTGSNSGNETTGSALTTCPANCTEARATGWTNSTQLAQMCPDLDRDKDGRACEN